MQTIFQCYFLPPPPINIVLVLTPCHLYDNMGHELVLHMVFIKLNLIVTLRCSLNRLRQIYYGGKQFRAELLA